MELTLKPLLEDGQITVVDLDTQLEMARAELKKYNYVVTENNYKDAKKDRADLRKLVEQVSDARKTFEKTAFYKWGEEKKKITNFEKEVSGIADELGKGLKVFDDKEREEKRVQILEAWESLLEERNSDFYDLTPRFNDKWLNKTTSAKSIEDDLKAIHDKITQDLGFMSTFLPTDEIEAEQVKEAYFKEYDLTFAKMKADELKRVRERVESQKAQGNINTLESQESSAIAPLDGSESVLEQKKDSVNTNWAVFRVEGTKEDLMELTLKLRELMAKSNFKYSVTEKGEL